jgi:hypothetical protein
VHPIEEFVTELAAFSDYPPDVVPVPELLPGTAAFGASVGLYREAGSTALPKFPTGGLMVVGHNLDSVENYESRRATGFSHGNHGPGVPTMSTWRGLYRLLELAGLDRRQLFFTNVYVGLKQGKPTGQFSHHAAPRYRRWCREFLEHQYLKMRPKVVLVLGEPAWSELSVAADQQPWPIGRLAPPGQARLKLYGEETLVVPAHHTSMQKRIAPDAAALRAAWLDA